MKKHTCISCGKDPLSKNETGITLKLLGENTTVYYCIDCLADYLEVTVQELEDKIEEFKEQGCKLFE
jgi:DNA-directed RNA polymerase subunit RPC12/RpoP